GEVRDAGELGIGREQGRPGDDRAGEVGTGELGKAGERVGQAGGEAVDGVLIAHRARAEVLVVGRFVGAGDFEVLGRDGQVAGADDKAAGEFPLDIEYELHKSRGERVGIEEADGVADVSLGAETGAGGLQDAGGKRIRERRGKGDAAIVRSNDVG